MASNLAEYQMLDDYVFFLFFYPGVSSMTKEYQKWLERAVTKENSDTQGPNNTEVISSLARLARDTSKP